METILEKVEKVAREARVESVVSVVSVVTVIRERLVELLHTSISTNLLHNRLFLLRRREWQLGS